MSDYDPFSPNDAVTTKSLTVRNTGHRACSFRVRFLRTPPVAKFDSIIGYSITDLSGGDLFIDENAMAASSRSLETTEVAVQSSATVAYSVNVPRGQLASPGAYNDSFSIVLQPIDSDFVLDRKTMWIRLPVKSVSSLNISGGGVATAIDFGALEIGKMRSVIMDARSNERYSLRLSSRQHGRLRLDPPVSGQDWSVRYRMDVDNAPADLSSNSISLNVGSGPLGGRSHTLSFQILEAANKRAGIYKDVITATIIPLH